MSTSQYTGVGTAMITPFDKDGAVDHAKLAEFVEFQIAGGVNFLVPCGTTGESATMTEEEQFAVVKTTLQAARGRVPVLAGCGGNNTAEIIARGKHMRTLGVTHILSVSPYYNKPTQEGIYQHYKAIRKQTGLEIVLYSVQSRTGSNVAPETVARLTEEKIIFGIKEASGSIQQIQKICDLTAGRLQVLSGDDAITLPLLAVGGVGVISVASNVVPGAMREWLDTMLAANFDKARALLHKLLPLFEALFVESNPIPVKGAASLLGLMDATYRLPLVAPAESTMHLLRQVVAPFRAR